MSIILAIIGLSLIIFVHELGHFIAARLSGVRVLEFGIGFPPRLWSRRFGETLLSFNALPFGGFVRLYGENEAVGGDARAFINQPLWRKAATLVSGVLMNVVFGWIAFSAVFALGLPEHLFIVGVAPGSPAARAGIMRGDLISEARIGELVLRDPVSSDEFIAGVRAAEEEPIFLTVQNGSDVRSFTLVGRAHPPEGEGSLGIELSRVGFPPLPITAALSRAFQATTETLAAIIAGFWHIISSIFTAPRVLESIAGPVGIIDITVRTGSLGVTYLLQLLALISLNLAVLNLIPFPALDGGRLLLSVLERVRGIRISLRIQRAVNAVGLAALLILMVLVTIQDIGQIVR